MAGRLSYPINTDGYLFSFSFIFHFIHLFNHSIFISYQLIIIQPVNWLINMPKLGIHLFCYYPFYKIVGIFLSSKTSYLVLKDDPTSSCCFVCLFDFCLCCNFAVLWLSM